MARVLVVGAGLAGAAAAHALVERGHAPVVIEARERVGGRGFARPFLGDGPTLEFGGAWITPWHAAIRGLCARAGVALRPRTALGPRLWLRDGGLHADGPTSAEDRDRHERAIARVAADAAFLKAGRDADERGRPIAGVSLADYLDRLDAPAATRTLLSAWWTVSGAADKSLAPATELLASSIYGGGLTEATTDAWADTLDGGVQGLAGRLLGQTGVALRLGAPVARLAHGSDGVAATLADGETIRAEAGIVATGLNPMAGVAFDPPLPPERRAALAHGHLGRGTKVWVKAEGPGLGVLATGGGSGIEWMFADRAEPDGAVYLAGFGVQAPGGTQDPAGDAERAFSRFFPGARLLGIDWHDWAADPWSRGSWAAAVAGAEERFTSAFWRPIGRLAFASSDFAARDAGWFEGAAVSGAEAAEAVARALAG